jgi:hypothetical protein
MVKTQIVGHFGERTLYANSKGEFVVIAGNRYFINKVPKRR